eukprot:Phypoly_transcript_08054.p1 GENE.Phypoly_transcript_08054~~Phypoly_transcript_08054.p1  ORF type:complete len:139 (+),score=15.88 Phypoly_transcript_08054:1115-1531(+)
MIRNFYSNFILQALMKNTSNGKYAALDRVIQEDNEAFIRNQQQVQEQIIKEQDTELEQISQTVDTMKHMGDAIYVELNSQNKILEDLDSGVDSTHGRLLAVSRRVTNLLNSRSDRVQWGLIIFLTLVLIGLVIVVFYV